MLQAHPCLVQKDAWWGPSLSHWSLRSRRPQQPSAPGVLSPPSQIYCTGELLRQVQEARLFSDDKHFVDMPLQQDPGE